MEVLIILLLIWGISKFVEAASPSARKSRPLPPANRPKAPAPVALEDILDEWKGSQHKPKDQEGSSAPLDQKRAKDAAKERNKRTPQRINKDIQQPRELLEQNGLIELAQAELEDIGRRKTMRKSRYADRNIQVGLTEAEKRDLGLLESEETPMPMDRESILWGLVWQQILNEPKARRPRL